MTTPLGAGRPAVPASWLRMALAVSANEVRLALRRGEGLLITFVIPVGVLLVFSAFDPAGGSTASPAVDRLLPGSIALAVIGASFVSLAISTGYERAYGVLRRLGGSPAGSSVVVAGVKLRGRGLKHKTVWKIRLRDGTERTYETPSTGKPPFNPSL